MKTNSGILRLLLPLGTVWAFGQVLFGLEIKQIGLLWVTRALSALGIKDFRCVLLGMLRGVTAPPIDHAEAA